MPSTDPAQLPPAVLTPDPLTATSPSSRLSSHVEETLQCLGCPALNCNPHPCSQHCSLPVPAVFPPPPAPHGICPLLTDYGVQCRLTPQAWVVQTPHIPKKGLALARLLVGDLKSSDCPPCKCPPLLGALGRTAACANTAMDGRALPCGSSWTAEGAGG